MKTSISITRLKNTFLTLVTLMMIFSFGQCAAQAEFLSSSVVPGARGSVTVTKDKYNNYIVKLEVTYLVEASRLTPPKNTYVVWMVTDKDATVNIGQIRTSTSFLSKTLKASLETKSSFKPVKIFLTAEYDPNLQNPSKEIVLTTDNFDLPKE
jgi:hypothetical protein